MCQIIALETTVKKFKKMMKMDVYPSLFNDILKEKGGDYYSVVAVTENGLQYRDSEVLGCVRPLKMILNKIKEDELQGSINLGLLLFSRQQPEMETLEAQEQPYNHVDYEGPGEGLTFAVHGTIHNDKELSKEMHVDIKADTEILMHLDPSRWDEAKGTFGVLGLNKFGRVQKYNSGLKLWSNYIVDNDKHLADIYSTTELCFFNPTPAPGLGSYTEEEARTLFVSFSGGMDIAMSVYKTLKEQNYTKVVLNYFMWGSAAEASEIESLEKFKDFYTKEFNIEVEVHIMQAQKYFSEYFKMNGAPIPRISKENGFYSGIPEETESPLAYVPYRNTQFALLLASKAEAQELKNVDILFGLNLSEGMVYMDNSEGWLESIQETVKYGGKDFAISGTYRILSPYYPRTKTNMLKEFRDEFGIAILEQLLGISKSCYYPKADGKPCGECGSCILRAKALENLK